MTDPAGAERSQPQRSEAERLAHVERMWAGDSASRALGMVATTIELDHAVVELTVTEPMVNGHGSCHGGYLFTVCDSAFALACNTVGAVTVASGAEITFVTAARLGDQLRADARNRTSFGRNGITDVTLSRPSDGAVIAEFRGHARTIAR